MEIETEIILITNKNKKIIHDFFYKHLITIINMCKIIALLGILILLQEDSS